MPGLLLILGLGLFLAWLGAVLAIDRVLTRPPRRTYASAIARGRPGDPGEMDPPRRFESWWLETRGVRLPVWDIAGDSPAGPIIIASHGWGDSRLGVLQRLPLLAPFARRIIAWDMLGHGDAPGSSSLGTHEVGDLLALLERAAASEPEPDRRVVLYGWSLGAGVSIAGAADERGGRAPGGATILGVIAEAPYRLPRTPADRMIRVMRWPAPGALRPALWMAALRAPGLRGDQFDRAAHAARLPCPLLVLHGEDDEICPIADARDIVATAQAAGVVRAALVAFPGAGHNDLWQSESRLAQGGAAVGEFMSRLA